MRFRLNKLIFAPVGSRQVEQLDRGPTWLDDDLKVSYLKGEITFTRTNDCVLVEGTIQTATLLQCSRSLEMFELPLTVSLDDVAFTLPGFPVPEPDLRIRDDGWIDLVETLRELVIMTIPINPISPGFRDGNSTADLVDEQESEWLRVKWASQNP